MHRARSKDPRSVAPSCPGPDRPGSSVACKPVWRSWKRRRFVIVRSWVRVPPPARTARRPHRRCDASPRAADSSPPPRVIGPPPTGRAAWRRRAAVCGRGPLADHRGVHRAAASLRMRSKHRAPELCLGEAVGERRTRTELRRHGDRRRSSRTSGPWHTSWTMPTARASARRAGGALKTTSSVRDPHAWRTISRAATGKGTPTASSLAPMRAGARSGPTVTRTRQDATPRHRRAVDRGHRRLGEAKQRFEAERAGPPRGARHTPASESTTRRRSTPAEKTRPAPVRTTARTSGSCSRPSSVRSELLHAARRRWR